MVIFYLLIFGLDLMLLPAPVRFERIQEQVYFKRVGLIPIVQ